MKNLLKEKFEEGLKTVGTFVEMGNGSSAEAISMTALDYIIIDTEHGPFDVESTMDMIRAAELHNATAMVRVKDSSRASILKMLDVGAKGLIIPQVHSLEEVKNIVDSAKYYPVGQRGVAFARGAGFGYAEHALGNIEDYFKIANTETLLFPQCETAGCLAEIEKIAQVEGVDGIFIGPYDLSVAMGIPTQFDKPEFKEAIERIRKACEAAGKFCIIYCANPDVAKLRFLQGFKSVTVSQDVNIFIDAVNNYVKSVQS